MNEKIQPVIQLLQQRNPLQPLSPASIWDEELNRKIASWEAVGVEQLAVKSGLHLWNDDLHSSHEISQSLDNDTGSYWHGIMHRMEQDYSNAKYWFRLAGKHPVFAQVKSAVKTFLEERADSHPSLQVLVNEEEWKAATFVDLVQQAEKTSDEQLQDGLKQIQRLEIELLLNYRM